MTFLQSYFSAGINKLIRESSVRINCPFDLASTVLLKMDTEFACKACTFINERGTKICNACGRTLALPSIDLKQVGTLCPQCTYDNPPTAVNCGVCQGPLIKAEPKKVSVSNEECEICFCPMSAIFTMPICSHIFCSNCAKHYFTTKIMQCGYNEFRCPIDGCVWFDELSNKSEFFHKLKSLLRAVLDEKTYKVYVDKIAVLDILDDPGFLRCPLCNRGFVSINTVNKMTYCPGCTKTFCSKCSSEWSNGHSKVDCKTVRQLSEIGDTAINATCPKCKYKYYLERGGCMHITCTQCSYEYCEFCFEKITGKGKSCDFKNCTKKQSLHGHHPRNCMYYLREMDHAQLETLLKKIGVKYLTNHGTVSTCQIQVSVEISGNWQDSVCNEPALKAYNNLCSHHYKWHLGELIKKYAIDPVHVMNSLECSCELKRNNIAITNPQPEYKPIEDSHTNGLRALVRVLLPFKKLPQ